MTSREWELYPENDNHSLASRINSEVARMKSEVCEGFNTIPEISRCNFSGGNALKLYCQGCLACKNFDQKVCFIEMKTS